MFGLGVPELIIILGLAVIFFGVGKLPELGTGLGKAMRGFRKSMSEPDPLEDLRGKREKPPAGSRSDSIKASDQ